MAPAKEVQEKIDEHDANRTNGTGKDLRIVITDDAGILGVVITAE